MSRQQKRNLLSNIYFYISFISFALSIITFLLSLLIINDGTIKGVFFFISFSFLICFLIFFLFLEKIDYRFSIVRLKATVLPAFYGFKGVPLNKFNDFYLPENYIENNIVFTEVKKDVFETKIKNKTFVYDMRGWKKSIKYISKLIITELQIFYTKGNRKLIWKSIYVPFERISLRFNRMNGKIIERSIVINNKTKITVDFKLDMISKLGLITCSRIPFELLYDFNY